MQYGYKPYFSRSVTEIWMFVTYKTKLSSQFSLIINLPFKKTGIFNDLTLQANNADLEPPTIKCILIWGFHHYKDHKHYLKPVIYQITDKQP